jgi:hypothetical protein
MAGPVFAGEARPMDDGDTINRIRAAMARHGLPVVDLSESDVGARAVALTGRQDGLERVARAPEASGDDDESA